MSKMKLFKQAEQMYLKGSTVSEISLELGIAKRTLFYWKKLYGWDKKRKESMYDKSQFKEDLQKFAQKLMDRIINNKQNQKNINQAEFYTLANILYYIKNFFKIDLYQKTKRKKRNKQLSETVIKDIEEKLFCKIV